MIGGAASGRRMAVGGAGSSGAASGGAGGARAGSGVERGSGRGAAIGCGVGSTGCWFAGSSAIGGDAAGAGRDEGRGKVASATIGGGGALVTGAGMAAAGASSSRGAITCGGGAGSSLGFVTSGRGGGSGRGAAGSAIGLGSAWIGGAGGDVTLADSGTTTGGGSTSLASLWRILGIGGSGDFDFAAGESSSPLRQRSLFFGSAGTTASVFARLEELVISGGVVATIAATATGFRSSPGTRTSAWHFGQRRVCPERLSETISVCPEGHLIRSGIGRFVQTKKAGTRRPLQSVRCCSGGQHSGAFLRNSPKREDARRGLFCRNALHWRPTIGPRIPACSLPSSPAWELRRRRAGR